ncbi:MAG: hypothetical protein GXP01_02920 [Alphaproteobacteria bacterium]|nr:hypothetical protein [Alphaproteobacteria bacterium]
MTAQRINPPEPVSVYLDPDQPLRRLPPRPELVRPEKFMAQFEDRALFYDIFRAGDGKRVFMLGPIELNLGRYYSRLRVTGHPSGKTVRFKRAPYVKASLLGWVTLPPQDTELSFQFAGQHFRVPIAVNHAELFENQRVAFTINQNNELRWIADWAEFYVKEHGATAAVIYDNRSDLYSVADVENALAAVSGLKKYMVVPWDHPFGATDPAWRGKARDWARFAQPVLYTQFMHRFAWRAVSIVNADIDELVISSKRRSIFEAVENARFGLIKFPFKLVENITDTRPAEARHRDYLACERGFVINPRALRKWAMAPARLWLRGLPVLPVNHNVLHAISGNTTSDEFVNYHFKAITSGWRSKRNSGDLATNALKRETASRFDAGLHLQDPLLVATMGETFGKSASPAQPDSKAAQ